MIAVNFCPNSNNELRCQLHTLSLHKTGGQDRQNPKAVPLAVSKRRLETWHCGSFFLIKVVDVSFSKFNKKLSHFCANQIKEHFSFFLGCFAGVAHSGILTYFGPRALCPDPFFGKGFYFIFRSVLLFDYLWVLRIS